MGFINTTVAEKITQGIDDPITKNFINMIYAIALRKCYFDKTDCPDGDFDIAFLTRVLEEFFSNKDVVGRTLNGERVDGWFED